MNRTPWVRALAIACALQPLAYVSAQAQMPATYPDANGIQQRVQPTYSVPGQGQTAPGVTNTPQSYQLLSNASSSGSAISNVIGGAYLLSDSGSYGGATITYQVTSADGTTLTTFYSDTAGGVQGCVNIGAGSTVQAIVSGGSPSALYAKLAGTGSCPNPIGTPNSVRESGLGYLASGKAAVTTNLSAAGVSGTFTPLAHRAFHMLIAAGTGVATCYIEKQVDGSHWFYQTVNGSPFGSVSYNGSPIDESVVEDQANTPVRWDCGGTYGSYTSGTIPLEITQ